ncbi:DinB family protein [Rubripirellula sp.]|nr:DinB family protein [Rubripirellula sp.]MDB4338721.1 DinB family protein [Rubripirellula sp.]
MSKIGLMIAASARLGSGYAERLLKDVTPEHFARLAVSGQQVVDSNHPAFIYGHLSLYAPRIVSELGGDASSMQPTELFELRFSKDATCVDDPEGTLYPSMDEIVTAFKTNHEAAINQLEATDDDIFRQENPNEGMRKLFPTIGAMHAFYVGGHLMMHMGQMSAWRRIAGLGPA